MSNNVDRRIVEMKFDNKDFEDNVQTSVKSLDKLKKSLDLEESAKGLSALEKSGRKFNLNGIVDAAEAVTSKFSIMGTVGDQVLRRITDAALNAFNKMKGIVDSLTIQPIYTGFQEYETQINSVQTILSNTRDELTKKGYDDAGRLALVNEKLDQLNHYADKTIYNFTQMTESIGKFTAAGVDLETSVAAIQGIANLAAVSGSNAEQASNAMYMLSQAMSAGTITLYHWNSVVRAGMGGEIFQKALIRTAKAMGKTVDVTVEEVDKAGKKVRKTVKRSIQELVDEEGFRKSLEKGWLTTDILTAALDQFSWDFEQIAENTFLDDEKRDTFIQKLAEMYIGQGDEADVALEKAKKMIGEMTNLSVQAVKELKMADLLASGYTMDEAEEIIRLAQDATEAATKVKTLTQLFDTLKEAAQSGWTQTWEYFIGDFAEAKSALTEVSKYFGKLIDDSANARNAVMKEWHDNGGRDMFWNNDEKKGPLGALWNFVYGIKNLIQIVKEEFRDLIPQITTQSLLSFTQRLQQITANFKAWTENSESMGKIRRILAGVAAALDIVKSAIGFVWRGFMKLFGASEISGDSFLEFVARIGDWLVSVKESMKTSEGFQKFLTRIGSVIASVRDVAIGAFSVVSGWISKIWNKVKGTGIVTKIGNGISNFIGKIPNAISKVRKWVRELLDYIKTSDLLQSTWSKITSFFGPAINSFEQFAQRFKTGLSNFFEKDVSGEETMVGKLRARLSAFGSAFTDWFASIKSSASNAWTNIKNYLTTLFTETIPNFFSSKKVQGSSLVEKIKGVNWGEIIKKGLGIAALIEVIRLIHNFSKIGKISDAFENLTKTMKSIAKNGASLTKDGLFINGKKKNPFADNLLKIAAAIAVLVGSVYVLAKMDGDSIMKGLGILTVLATEMLVISALFSRMHLDGSAVLKAAAAILLLVIPIKMLSAMRTDLALKGILAVGVILAELALFTRLMGKNFNEKQAGFLGLGIAVNLLVIAIKNLSKLNVGSMGKSLVGMGALLLEIAIFSRMVSKSKITGMISMAIGLNLMVIALKQVAKMNTKNLIKGVLGLGSVMLAFGTMIKLSKGVNLGNALIILAMMAGSLMMIVHAFREVEGANMDDMLKFSGSVSLMMASLAIALKILSTIPVTGALAGLANIALFIVGLGALVVGLGALQSKWGGMTDFLERGGDVLEKIGNAIGRFVGGIGAGFGEAINLPQLGTDLSDFMKNADGFIQGAKNVDGDVLAGVGYLTASVIAIAATEFINALATLFGGEDPVSKFSTDIVALGEGLNGYAQAVSPLKSVPQTTLDRSIAVATALTGVVDAMPSTGGWLDAIIGVKDVEAFSTGLTSLADGLVAFATEVSVIKADEFDDDKINVLLAISTAISTLESNLEGQGGLEDLILGVQSLSEFQEGFKPFAEGLNKFVQEIRKIEYDPKPEGEDATKMDALIALAERLSALERSLKAQGGVAQLFAGTKSLFSFSLKIPTFGANLNKFVQEIRKIEYDPNPEGEDAKHMSALIALAERLSALEGALPRHEGLWQEIIGDHFLGAFGGEIPDFATGLNTFVDKVKEINYDSDGEEGKKMQALLDLAKDLSALESNLERQGGWEDSILGSKDLGTFANNIKLLGQAIASYMTDVQKVDASKTEDSIGALQIIKGFVDGFETSGGLWEKIGDFFGGTKFNTLLTYTGSMRQMGDDLKTFSDYINEVKGKNFDFATTIFGKMQEFINGLDKSGGLGEGIKTWFTGDEFTTLTKIASNMAAFGSSLKGFGDGLEGLDDYSILEDRIDNLRYVVGRFINLARDIDKDKEKSSVSYTALGKVSKQMSNFATPFNSFRSAISNAADTKKQFEHVETILSSFITFADDLTKSNSDLQFDKLKTLLELVGKSGGFLKKFYEGLGTVPVEELNVAANAISTVVAALDVAGSIPNYSADPIQTILDNLSKIVFPEFDTEGLESARAFISSLTEGIEDASAILAITTAISTLSSEGSSAADGTYSVWYSSGQYLGAGLGAGISSMAESVRKQAVSVASGAIQSIRMTWSVRSPSKVGEELGMYFDLGLAGGLDAYSKVVSGKAEDMSQNVVDSASTMLRGADGSIFDNIDPNPTIRPVMDLTNVQNGVNSINSMFDASRMSAIGLFSGMNLSRRVNSLNLDNGRIAGTLTDKNIVSRLEGLQTKIEQLGEAVTNMKLVLDTGALVGGTSARMDDALGTLAMRKGRGN